MENYDLIMIGTGSAMNYLDLIIDSNPEMKIAVIDKDEPGGICLTGGVFLQKYYSTLQNLSGNWELHLFLG